MKRSILKQFSPSIHASHSLSTQHNYDCVEDYKSLPKLEITSDVNKIPHLTDSDIDLHMPSDTNFNYYSTSDFHNNKEITNCISDKPIYLFHSL